MLSLSILSQEQLIAMKITKAMVNALKKEAKAIPEEQYRSLYSTPEAKQFMEEGSYVAVVGHTKFVPNELGQHVTRSPKQVTKHYGNCFNCLLCLIQAPPPLHHLYLS